MTDYRKPLPELTAVNRPFWDACRDGRLSMQRCRVCGHIRYPVSPVCPGCLSEQTEWVDLRGEGEVMARLVFHQVYHRAFADDVPYNVVLVQLDEGPRMFSNVVGVPNEAVRVGMRVKVLFDPVTPEITIPRFRPVRT
jgi:uncharacterized OB-fold protein